MNPENKKTSRGGTRAGKPRTPLTPRQKALRIACLVLAILAAVLVTVFAAYRLLVVKPSLPEPGVELPDEDQNYEFGDGPRLSGDRKEEFYTFLLVGRDTGGGGNTDTLMVMAYDIPNQTLNVMSIPRDTMVNVPWDIKRINSVYNYAPYYDKDGIQFLKEEVSYLIGFQPDYTIVVEWEAVGELVDAIGGVEFDVPIDMNYDDPTQNLHIHLSAGLQDIDGDKAMQLLRWRKNSDAYGNVYGGYPNGDLGRIETQQAFLKAVIEKCLNSISLGTIPKMAQIFLDNVDTNGSLTVNNLAWFAKEAIVGGLSMENVHFMTLPNRGASVYSRTYHNYQSYVTPIPDEMLELVNTCFNPYLEDIELNELDLMQVNEDGSLSFIGSPLLDGIIAVMFVAFFVMGVAYGFTVKKFRSLTDIEKAINKQMSFMGAYLTFCFFCGQFNALFSWTNIGTVIAIGGADFIQNIGLTGIPLILIFIVIVALTNLFMPSASAKWAILGPVFVPMLMMLNYHPAMIQLIYRLADSPFNIITPMNPYVWMLLSIANRDYDPNLKIGKVFAGLIPISLILAVVWIIFFFIWTTLGIPLGPGASYTLPAGLL